MLNIGKQIYSLAKRGGEYYKNNPAQFLSRTMALTLGLSSLAEGLAIAINDEIPKYEKKFLIPQEIAEGLITFGLFLAFTGPMEAVLKKAVAKGKILPESFSNASKDKIKEALSTEGSDLQKFQKGVAMVGSLLGTLVSVGIFVPIARNYSASKIRNYITKNDKPPGNKTDASEILISGKLNFNFGSTDSVVNKKIYNYKSMETFLSSTRRSLFR